MKQLVPKRLINVRGGHTFVDALKKIMKDGFEPSHPLSMKFADDVGSSQGAVDLGEPIREFLQLAVKDVFCKHGIFDGPEDNKVLLLNCQGTAAGNYMSS